MMLEWMGVSYPSVLDRKWVQSLWRSVFCPQGWHLWDEVLAPERHELYCDACELSFIGRVASTDRNWAERIEIAKAAREGGRILREGKEE